MPEGGRCGAGFRAAVVGLLLFRASAAHAEAGAGRFRFGPVYLSPRLELRNLGVDTNVFNTTGDPVRDLSVVMRPSTTAVLPIGGRTRLSGTGHVDFNYFGRTASESSVDFGGDGRVDVMLSRFGLYFAGSGLHAKQRFSIDLDARVPRRETSLELGVSGRLTSRITLALGVAEREYAFDRVVVGGSDVKEALDRVNRSGSLELRYAVTRQTSFLVSGDSISDRFTQQVGEGPRQTRSQRYLVGLSAGQRAVVTGRLLAGIRRHPDAKEDDGGAFQRLVLSTNVSAPMFGRARVTAVADRDVLYGAIAIRGAQDPLRNAYVWTRFRGELALELPADVVGRLFADRQIADYPRALPQAAQAILRHETQWSVGLSLLRSIGPRLRLGGTIEWARRASNAEGASFQGARYGMRAEYVP